MGCAVPTCCGGRPGVREEDLLDRAPHEKEPDLVGGELLTETTPVGALSAERVLSDEGSGSVERGMMSSIVGEFCPELCGTDGCS